MSYTKKQKEEQTKIKAISKKEILRNEIKERDHQKKKQTLSKKHCVFMNFYIHMKCVLMCMCGSLHTCAPVEARGER